MSNKKLTTEEKIAKSQLYSDEIENLKKKLAEKKAAQKKLEEEISAEQERQWKQNMRSLGEKVISLINGNFKRKQYEEILEYIFMLDEVVEYVAAEKKKLAQLEHISVDISA